MRLDGWNHVPDGYGATFDRTGAPLWLRVLVRTPFVDRFGYPLLVRRGLGQLHAHPGADPDPAVTAAARRAGWVIAPQPPTVGTPLVSRPDSC